MGHFWDPDKPAEDWRAEPVSPARNCTCAHLCAGYTARKTVLGPVFCSTPPYDFNSGREWKEATCPYHRMVECEGTVYQAAPGRWSWVVREKGQDVARGAGYDSEDEALEDMEEEMRVRR